MISHNNWITIARTLGDGVWFRMKVGKWGGRNEILPSTQTRVAYIRRVFARWPDILLWPKRWLWQSWLQPCDADVLTDAVVVVAVVAVVVIVVADDNKDNCNDDDGQYNIPSNSCFFCCRAIVCWARPPDNNQKTVSLTWRGQRGTHTSHTRIQYPWLAELRSVEETNPEKAATMCTTFIAKLVLGIVNTLVFVSLWHQLHHVFASQHVSLGQSLTQSSSFCIHLFLCQPFLPRFVSWTHLLCSPC